ncbi:hypothetical protein [Deinococcus roseus]|uniref:Glycosyl hydrolase family 32 N-terminal domain-containing protein n=1 Tax=Deinococcus roseus TaxID=392414 RepID=A0ABQ2D8W7_9DEIO|nr:hypothetical protein [Deinococcus roseus]GGJ49730.1 hypothetical protein GCM10008938_39620 [Deinococcus roseus]
MKLIQKTIALSLLGLSLMVGCNQPSSSSLSGTPASTSQVIEKSALAGFPTFTYQKVIASPVSWPAAGPDTTYNEFIFPSVIKASNYFANPLGTYYMYYAPHNAPAGIYLAYSNNLNGPWTRYSDLPIITREWMTQVTGSTKTISHISSPHAIWVPDETTSSKLYLYLHGENTDTRLVKSADGIHFTYDKTVISTSGTYKKIDGLSEVSYARVYRYTIPSKGNKYIMLLMGNNGGTRKIYLCWSGEARNWRCQNNALITPNSAESGGAFDGPQVSGPAFFPWKGKYYVAYHSGAGDIHLAEVGANFDQENHLGVLYDSLSTFPEYGRAGAPTFITEGSTMYMFYEMGQRDKTRIALATAPL